MGDSVVVRMRDFLISRKRQILVEGIKSSICEVTLGVRQGSVLGALLFFIYISLMVEKFQEDGLYLFADDLKVYQVIASDVIGCCYVFFSCVCGCFFMCVFCIKGSC